MQYLAMGGTFVAFLALAAAISALLGCASAWVLGHFGVHVAWYVCSVAIFILGSIKGSAK